MSAPRGQPPRLRVGDLVAATPAGRDRYVDLLRAASILAVVAGHWMVATVVERPDGLLDGTNALAEVAWLRLATWLVQVMPVFFIVGGFSNARALARPEADVDRFLAGRADRLLRPTIPFAAVWLVVAALLARWVDDERLVRDVARIAGQPLWFLAVYLVVVALAPVQLRLYRIRPVLALVALPLVVVLLDVFRFTDVAPALAVGNYLAVFLVAQQLGFAYAEGRFEGVRTGTAVLVSVVAFALLALLVTVGPYPVSMVGVPGEATSNMSPPTVCILVLVVAQAGLLLALRPAGRRWLQRPRVWQAVVVVNVVILTVFLWHLTALVLWGGSWLVAGVPWPEIGTAAWWLERIPWFLGAAVVLVLLVAVFSPVERAPLRLAPFGGTWVRVVGVVLAFRGLAGLALAGFARATSAGGAPLLGLRLSPLVAFALLAAGWLLAAGLPSRAPRPT